jgi:3-oxoadipate enol-lactonase
MSTAAIDDRFAARDGATIAFTHHPAPRADAPRLALVHSLALDRSVWDAVVERLRAEAEVLTYDCRGHGRSERRPGVYSAESFADDLGALLDHVGWERAAIAGCSMGGCVALAFAGLFPARVTALGLIDTTAWYGEDAPAKFRERAAAAREKGMRGLAEFQVTRWFSDGYREQNPPALQRALEIFVANDDECYAATCALLGDADLRPYLRDITVPVAIVVGEEDYATPVAMAQQLHAEIPQSTLTVLPRARHLTPIEHPDTIAAELLSLLRRSGS